MKISANDLSYVADKFKKVPRKLKREFAKIPPFSTIQSQIYQKATNAHTKFLPQLDAQGRSIVETLRQEGTCIIPIESLGLDSSKTMLSTAYRLADNLKQQLPNVDNSCEVGSSAEDLREFPEILLWAVEPKILDIVENYIGLPILYQYFAMRRSIADGQYSGVRRWHIDWEDRRVIKVIIYLNDVVAGGGAYEYISRDVTSKAMGKLNYSNLGYVADEKMMEAVPKSSWNTCLASKATVIISDTASVFHRAQPPVENERFSISFCYTSTKPQVIWNSRKVTPQQWEFINSQTDRRQKSCFNPKLLSQFA